MYEVYSVEYSRKSFYCKNCKINHSLLYKNKGNSYCEKCVPKEVKKKAIRLNASFKEVKNEE